MHAGWCPSGTSNPVGLFMGTGRFDSDALPPHLLVLESRRRAMSRIYNRTTRRRNGKSKSSYYIAMRSKKSKPFESTTEVKRQARRRVGSPPAAQTHQDRRKKLPKHKKHAEQIETEIS